MNPVYTDETVIQVIRSGGSGANYILEHKKEERYQKQEKAAPTQS